MIQAAQNKSHNPAHTLQVKIKAGSKI